MRSGTGSSGKRVSSAPDVEMENCPSSPPASSVGSDDSCSREWSEASGRSTAPPEVLESIVFKPVWGLLVFYTGGMKDDLNLDADLDPGWIEGFITEGSYGERG